MEDIKELEKQSLFEMYSKVVPLDYNDMKEKVIFFYKKIIEIESTPNYKIPYNIEDLDLSFRSFNVLRSKMKTVIELLEYTENKLLKIRGMGKQSVYEIKEELKKHGWELKQE